MFGTQKCRGTPESNICCQKATYMLLSQSVQSLIWKNTEFGDFEHVAIQNLKDFTKGCQRPFWAWKTLFFTIIFILVRQNLEKINWGAFKKIEFWWFCNSFAFVKLLVLGNFGAKSVTFPKSIQRWFCWLLCFTLKKVDKFWKFKLFWYPKVPWYPKKQHMLLSQPLHSSYGKMLNLAILSMWPFKI